MMPQSSFKTRFFNIGRNIFKIPLLERWLCEQTQGKSPKSIIGKLPPNHYQYPKATIRQATRQGIHYHLDLHDFVDWHIYFGFQDSGKDTLYELIKEGHTVLDIGVNVGEVTLNAAQKVGKSGKVIGFEPHPTNFQRCQRNIALNKLDNITVENKGLGHQKGMFQIYAVDEGNAGKNRIDETHRDAPATTVQIITLDEYVQNNQLKQIDVIKIDVEGFELKVLQGAKQTLQQFHPTLFIELDDNNLKEQAGSAKALVTFLSNLGYTIWRATTGKLVLNDHDFTNCHWDVVANYELGIRN